MKAGSAPDYMKMWTHEPMHEQIYLEVLKYFTAGLLCSTQVSTGQFHRFIHNKQHTTQHTQQTIHNTKHTSVCTVSLR